MQYSISFLLFPLMALLLVAGQALWNSAIKNQHLLSGTPSKIIANLISSPRVWAGALIYVAATGVYFLLLSKNKFFIVQVTMTALAIIFSTILAAYLFNERISAWNFLGICLVLIGLFFVLSK